MRPRSGRDDAQAFHEAWESGTPATAEVAELVRAAERVCESAVATPRPEFRAALRERLLVEAQTALVPDPGASRRAVANRTPATVAPTRPRARRRLAGLAVAAVSSLGVVGMVAGSAQAIPGDVLYPVKRGVENVELAMQRTDEGRGTQRLEIAAERLREARAVLGDGSTKQRAQVSSLLDDFSTQAEQGSSELFGAFGSDGSTATIDTVNDFAAASAVDLSVMSAEVPADAAAAFDSATAVVTDLAGQAGRLCGTCAKADVDALVQVVQQVVRPGRPASASDAEPAASTRDDTAPAAVTKKPSSGGASSAPPAAPAPVSPSPSATPQGLRAVTDPLVGGLLGNEETEGLVPGLLDGLLGTKK
ncbi:DUF5667 domain-containing protein [Aeromicrobium sp. 50.2.37]|uniref:DUF5667 domain-containing protein n=1 Tax=Aeromicrobium sp. 50.2.37 TaxID=2969305 RepID=UPI00214F816E|nr:DUF5667 domain-containing protein [Aeromicrobium sp. 50.2.37]MCR4513891.1 DUF5667 domain-containing protein [Aeromicrobium sp. 50.2.37]